MFAKRLLVFLIACSGLQSGLLESSVQQHISTSLRAQSAREQGVLFTRNKTSCGTYLDCPPWTECKNNDCVCRKEIQKYSETVKCNDATLQLSVRKYTCVTYDDSTGEISVGRCIKDCYYEEYSDIIYLPLPLNVSKLNQFMCEESWNRTGRLCGKCLPGHSPLAYSYDLRCVECPEGNRNVWKYILVAYGPLTMFYFIVLFLKINATSSHLHGYLLFAQLFSSPAYTHTAAAFLNSTCSSDTNRIALDIVRALYGIWNLDFFRGLYPDICLDVSIITVLALDYAVAIYPLLLTVVSYFLIELHARNCRIVVILWKPFGYFGKLFRKNWDIKTTIVDAFTTFFILSFSKIAWISLDLLTPVTIYSISSNGTTKTAFFYNATVGYFRENHLPYAILALVFCFAFVITPTILLLCYQVKLIQRMLSCLNVHCRLLQVVMDSVQGHYKDGTEAGTKDRRWFAAIPLIGRFAVFVLYVVSLDIATLMPSVIAIIVSIIVLTALVQPYKNRFASYSKIDIFFWGLLAVIFSLLHQANSSRWRAVQSLPGFVAMVFAIVYMVCASAYWALSRMRIVKTLMSQLKARRRAYVNIQTEFETGRI